MHAAIVTGAVVQADPASQVGHRLGPRPVRIVLVPGDHAAVPRRLAEQLVVPEADRAVQQLAGRHRERRVPQHIVKARLDPPAPRAWNSTVLGSADSFVWYSYQSSCPSCSG